MKTPISL